MQLLFEACSVATRALFKTSELLAGGIVCLKIMRLIPRTCVPVWYVYVYIDRISNAPLKMPEILNSANNRLSPIYIVVYWGNLGVNYCYPMTELF